MLVELTDAGVVAVEGMFPILDQKLVSAYAGRYSEAELRTVAELMERV